MRVEYTSRAFRDREEILSYLHAHSPSGSRNVLKRFDEAVILLAAQPFVGTATDVPGVRVLFVGRYPYKVFYRVRMDLVEIVHIRHTSREPFQPR